MLCTALRSVVVETCVDCCPAPLGPGDSEPIEYMDMRFAMMSGWQSRCPSRDEDGEGVFPTRGFGFGGLRVCLAGIWRTRLSGSSDHSSKRVPQAECWRVQHAGWGVYAWSSPGNETKMQPPLESPLCNEGCELRSRENRKQESQGKSGEVNDRTGDPPKRMRRPLNTTEGENTEKANVEATDSTVSVAAG